MLDVQETSACLWTERNAYTNGTLKPSLESFERHFDTWEQWESLVAIEFYGKELNRQLSSWDK